MVTVIVTFRTDRQWLWDRAIKFAMWQHPAMLHGEVYFVWHQLFKPFPLDGSFQMLHELYWSTETLQYNVTNTF